MKLIFICIVVIWLYVMFHLRSVFLSSMAMINVAGSVPISLVLYKLVFGIEYFMISHILIIILAIGIGADNTFIFNDYWNSTLEINSLKDDHVKRLSYTFRKATTAIIATSITNLFAYFATSLSQILPIKAFGIFASICVPMNYLLIIFILPSQYMLYEKHIKMRFNCFSFIK